jgi:hypothetical protein
MWYRVIPANVFHTKMKYFLHENFQICSTKINISFYCVIRVL